MSVLIPLTFRAFLSYAHADLRWGKWLHSQLEKFTIDKDLAGRETAMGPVTASDDHTARMWDAFPIVQQLIDRMKAEVPRCLTAEQRGRLFLAPEPPRWCITMQKWPYDPATLAAAKASAPQ